MSVLGPGEDESYRSSLLKAISESCGFSECKPHWFSKLDILGAHLSSAGLKSLGAGCGVPTLCSSVRSSGFEFPPDSGLHAGGGVYGEIVSQPLLPISMCFSSHFPGV